MAGKRKPDFSGWATKYGIKCTDGRTILPGAFKDMEGKKVPIVWGHIHDDPDMVLGHAILYNRPEGIWTEGYFNNNPKAQSTKETLRNGDVDGLSIYANELKHVNGREVEHGNIRELSVVLAGANKGATIENVLLAHDDFMYEPDDECIVYNDDEPLYHDEEVAEAQKKKKIPESEEDSEEEPKEDSKEDEDKDSEEESKEDSKEDKDEDSEEEETEETAEEENKDKLAHADVDGDGEEDDPQEIWNSMNKKQQDLCSYLVAQAASGEVGDENNEEDEEDSEMKQNAFEKDNSKPETYLSHADQKAIIERAVKLGSMKDAWEEALETNDTLSHDVFNDDGTVQSYGIANIDYLFPDYYELNDRPDFIRRPDDWVNVVLSGVYKTPKARLRTTHANITMDEARAKGYMKGNRKQEEVFNLLRRTVDPQTIYKKQKFDRDDIIDIDDFDVIAWVKVEMRDMLNEEIARAILLGDGREVSDPDKIFETHIRPIVNDDDLYAVKVPVLRAQTAADTAKNAIRSMIKNRKYYKGSGNLTFFTSEDALSEWLLLEDNFGHELYKDATELAKKMRVSKIVTCPFMEDLEVDGHPVMGIAVDLKDYATGTNRRGQVEFFDDFDIDFNQYKYLIETRLSGMLRKPYSAMVLVVVSESNPGPRYEEAELEGTENPKALGLYEKEGNVFRKSADTTVIEGKTYYIRKNGPATLPEEPLTPGN